MAAAKGRAPSTRGPLPKRNAQRAGHQASASMADELKGLRRLSSPPPPHEDWDPRCRALYQAAVNSGQSLLYEPSDWELLLTTLDIFSAWWASERKSSETLKVVMANFSLLGFTEYDRRWMRVEVHRDKPAAGGDAASGSEQPTAIAEQLKRLRSKGA